MTDEAYLELIHAGDMTGLIELQRRYWSPILSCAKAGFDKYELRRDDISTPEHVAQEVFDDFALFVMKHGYEEIGNVIAYICRMAKNRALKLLKMRHGDKVDDDLANIYSSSEDVETDWLNEETHAETNLRAFAIFLQLVYNERIPARQRLAMFLRDYGDMSSKEIAEMLEVKPSSVDSLVSQARAKLRKIFRATKKGRR